MYLLRIDKDMADIISGDDIAELMEAFARFDTDNDGLINTIELRRVRHFWAKILLMQNCKNWPMLWIQMKVGRLIYQNFYT